MVILNQPKTWPDHTAEEVRINKQTFYVCSVCGRMNFRKTKSHGKIYCTKHYRQVKKFGAPLDDNPRTTMDKNEIRIIGPIAEIDLYNDRSIVIGTAVIDAEDVPKIQHIKWKLSGSGYAMNTPKFKGGSIHMSRIILGTDQMVDHRDHNTLNNRKKNLREATKSENQMNSNYKGVTPRADGKFYAHIKLHGKMLNLGVYVFEPEALFARWYAETLLFKDFQYPKEKPSILPDRERQIMEYVDRKVQRL